MKFTPLHHAVDNGHLHAVEILLREGRCDPNAKDQNGATPMHWAAGAGRVDVLAALASRGAYVHGEDVAGATPLHWAAAKGREDAVPALLERGAPLDQMDGDGLTPLHRAAAMGHARCVKALMREGADPSRVDARGNNALHLACEGGQVGAVRAILSGEREAAKRAFAGVNEAGLTPTETSARAHEGSLPLLMEFKETTRVRAAPAKPCVERHYIIGKEKYERYARKSAEGGSSERGRRPGPPADDCRGCE